jgi:GT2 family glycosyltransferase
MKKLAIITVPWNVVDKNRKNYQALFKSECDFEFEAFAADNDSHDGSAEMIANEFPQVCLFANKVNLGFAKANNQAIREILARPENERPEYAMLLNPDMQVFPNTLKKMIDWMDSNPQATLAGCHLVDKDGKTVPHVRRYPGFLDQLAIVLKLPHLFPKILNNYLYRDFNYSQAAKVDSIRGSFFIFNLKRIDKLIKSASDEVKREITLPLLDERYFVWFEEVDFCRQVQKIGGEVWYTPVAECLDYVGQSFKQVKRGVTQVYFRNSMLTYFQKWHSAWQYWVLRVVWVLGFFMAWMGEKMSFKGKART